MYILCNSGVEYNEILGIYESREMAEKYLDYIGGEEAKDAAANLCDDTFQKSSDEEYETRTMSLKD